jgi:hypothetical protein
MMPPDGRNSKSSRTDTNMLVLALKALKSTNTARVARSSQPPVCSAATWHIIA